MTLNEVIKLIMEKIGPSDAKSYTITETCKSNNHIIYVYNSGRDEDLTHEDMDKYSIFTVINGKVVKDLYNLLENI